MRTVTVLCRKGGTGKTTIALGLALAAHQRRHRVVLADVDPQKSSQNTLALRRRPGPAVLSTTGGKLFALKGVLEKAEVDVLFIDTPSTVDPSILQSLHISDFCIVVARPNYLDLAAAAVTIGMLRQLRKPALIVLNQTPPARAGIEVTLMKRAREALALTNYPVAQSAIASRTSVVGALTRGLSVEEADPLGSGASEIAALWSEVAKAAGISARPHQSAPAGSAALTARHEEPSMTPSAQMAK